MAVKILTDSTCYIPKEYKEKYNISVISLNVIMNNKSYKEVDLDNIWFYDEMNKLSQIPTSSQPSIEDFYKAFEELVISGNDVVGIFISSEMSGTFSTSNLIKEMILENYPESKISLIDSRSNCMQTGFAVIEAARAAKEKKSLLEVTEVATNVINNSKFIFVPDSLEYLKKGGRIGGASALLGSLLQIRPILTVEDGKTSVLTKVRTKKKAIDKIIDIILDTNKHTPIKELIVHHINCQSEGLELATKLKDLLNINVEIQSIGPIIGLHVGPGSIGVAYHY